MLRWHTVGIRLHGGSALIAPETLAEREQFLTAEEVATMLKIAPQTARKLIRQGSIPAARIGAKWRVRRSDLEALFDR